MNSFPAALPRARTPDPRSAPSLRWGVLGTGWIADKFVTALQKHSSQRIVAVGSRSIESATGFARRFGIEHAHGSYEELVSDPDVDVVYIATPHNAHLPHALLALEAGKHTVVEKPLALNATQGQRIADVARSRGLFCMEAYWTAFLPKFDVLRQLLEAGALGDITAVVADFGEWFSAGHRIHRPELAGGPMLDLGDLSDQLRPRCHRAARPHRRIGYHDRHRRHGPDRHAVEPPRPAGRPAHQHPGQHSDGGDHCRHCGDHRHRRAVLPTGRIHPDSTDGATRLRYDEPRIAHEGLHYQAAEVARRITAGETGSPLRPLSASISVLRVMDEVRRQTRDRYPDEDDDRQ